LTSRARRKYHYDMMTQSSGTVLKIKNITVAEIKRRFSEVLGKVRYQRERLVVMRRSQPMAALVPLEDLRTLQALEAESKMPGQPRPGLLAAIGAWEDYDDLDRFIEQLYKAREAAAGRAVGFPS
jgi:prevent-host-death family protein